MLQLSDVRRGNLRQISVTRALSIVLESISYDGCDNFVSNYRHKGVDAIEICAWNWVTHDEVANSREISRQLIFTPILF